MPLCLQFMIVERRGSSGPQTFEGKVCIALHRKRANLLLKNQSSSCFIYFKKVFDIRQWDTELYSFGGAPKSL